MSVSSSSTTTKTYLQVQDESDRNSAKIYEYSYT